MRVVMTLKKVPYSLRVRGEEIALELHRAYIVGLHAAAGDDVLRAIPYKKHSSVS